MDKNQFGKIFIDFDLLPRLKNVTGRKCLYWFVQMQTTTYTGISKEKDVCLFTFNKNLSFRAADRDISEMAGKGPSTKCKSTEKRCLRKINNISIKTQMNKLFH